MTICIDETSMTLGLLLPFWFTFSVLIAVALGKRFETFVMGRYVEDVVKENNELIMENRRLKDELDDGFEEEVKY